MADAAMSEQEKVEEFHECARYGEMEGVTQWLSDGVPVDAADELGRTALFFASANGHTEVVNFLISHGALTSLYDGDIRVSRQNVAHTNTDGSTSLHWAALNGHVEAAKSLLAAGASASALNKGDMTPVDEAMRGPHQGVLDAIYEASGGGKDDEDDVEEDADEPPQIDPDEPLEDVE